MIKSDLHPSRISQSSIDIFLNLVSSPAHRFKIASKLTEFLAPNPLPGKASFLSKNDPSATVAARNGRIQL
jgi:hypothetical protein